jgi:hypothetical protein
MSLAIDVPAGKVAGDRVAARKTLADSGDLVFRFADAADAPAIGELHADSWRRHYRGAYADAFLDADAAEYCLGIWTERLRSPRAAARTIVAERNGELAGFAHTILDDDVTWGAFLDRLASWPANERFGGRQVVLRLLSSSWPRPEEPSPEDSGGAERMRAER